MKRSTVRRSSCFLLLPLILGCGDGDGPDPPMTAESAAVRGDSQPTAPATNENKVAPKGPTAVSPTRAY